VEPIIVTSSDATTYTTSTLGVGYVMSSGANIIITSGEECSHSALVANGTNDV
jgi:hypothetical protein